MSRPPGAAARFLRRAAARRALPAVLWLLALLALALPASLRAGDESLAWPAPGGHGFPVVVAGAPIPCGAVIPCDATAAGGASYLADRPRLDPAPVAVSDGTFVLVGQNGQIAVTDPDFQLTAIESPITSNLNAVAHA